jgi:hypothetical protein
MRFNENTERLAILGNNDFNMFFDALPSCLPMP